MEKMRAGGARIRGWAASLGPRLRGVRGSSAGFVTVGVAVVCTLAAAAVLVGTPTEGGAVDLLSGRAWLTNNEDGEVMLANGSSARVDLRFSIDGAEGHDLEVIQVGGRSLLIDHDTGEWRELDMAGLEVGDTHPLSDADSIDVLASGDKLLVVERDEGIVKVQDPLSGDVVAQRDVGSSLTRAVVDDADQIWVADREAGSAIPLHLDDGDEFAVGNSVRVGPGEDMTLALVDGAPVAVDPGRKMLVRINGTRADEPVSLPLEDGESTEVARVTDGGLASLAVNESGDLILVEGNSARRVQLGVSGHELGEPVVFDRRVFVPDFTTGQLLVIDDKGDKTFPGPQLGGAEPGRFSVRVEGGRLWVDDPDSDDAYVLGKGDDDFRKVDKGNEDVPSNIGAQTPLRPPPVPPAPSPSRAPVPSAPSSGPSPAPGTGGGQPGGTGAGQAPQTPARPPGAPPSVTGIAGNRQAVVAWGAAPANGGPISGYRVRWTVTGGRDGGSDGSRQVGGAQTQATIDGLHNGTTYTFSVEATNRAGTGPATRSNAVTPDGNVPDAPRGVQAEGGLDGAIDVSWREAEPNGASDIASYTVTATDQNGAAVTAAADVTGTSATIGDNLTLGNTYTITVSAINERGNTSVPSNPSDTLTLAAPADAPGGPNAAGTDGTVTVNWVEPALNGGTLSHYEVTGDNGAGTQQVPAGTGTVAFGGLANGTTYTFEIRAITQANGADLTGNAAGANAAPGRAPVVTTAATASGRTVNWSANFEGVESGPATCYVVANGAAVWSGPCQPTMAGSFEGPWSTDYVFYTNASNNYGTTNSNYASTRTADPPPPPRVATVSKGAPDRTVAGCPAAACARVRVALSGFPAGSGVSITCQDSDGAFYTYNRTVDGAGNSVSEVCVYGYPGRQVWVTASGTGSNRFTW